MLSDASTSLHTPAWLATANDTRGSRHDRTGSTCACGKDTAVRRWVHGQIATPSIHKRIAGIGRAAMIMAYARRMHNLKKIRLIGPTSLASVVESLPLRACLMSC
eukprot:4174976-Pleurochrysis_carterae.AAC.1